MKGLPRIGWWEGYFTLTARHIPWYSALLGSVILGIAVFVPAVRTSMAIQFIILEVCLLAVWLLLRAGRPRAATWLAVLTGWLLSMGVGFFTGGVSATHFVTFAVTLVAAGLLLGAGGATIIAAGSVVGGLLSMQLAGGPDPLLPNLSPQAPAMVRIAFGYLFIIIFLAVAQREMKAVILRRDESLSLLKATLDSTGDGILVVDTEGRVNGYNQHFLDLWAIPAELAQAGNDERMIAYVLHQLRDPASFSRRVKELYGQPDAVSSDRLEFKDGRVYDRYSRPQKLDGRTVGRVWSFRDVTGAIRAAETQRRLEADLFQAQKLEALGRLAGGIAHDFNNILTAIMSYSEMARNDAAGNQAVVENLDELQRASRRASDLVNQILLFSRTRAEGRVPLRLGQVAEEAVQLLRPSLPRGVSLVTRYTSQDDQVFADPTQVHQVVMNLGVNAAQALAATGGTITVTTEAVEVEDGAFPVAPGLAPGRYTVLGVADDGPGMDQATLARIYEPFFSTKAPGKGTGLGLALVHSIVRTHGGAIAVESAPGAGAAFRVYLPATERE